MVTKATTRQAQVALLFCAEGYMPSGASAITGNLSQESGRSLPSAFRHGRLDHGSQGLPQWRLDRLNDYMDYVKGIVDSDGTMPDDDLWEEYGRLDLQVKYICIEIARDYPALDELLRKGGSVSALTADICWQYERPSKYAANLANRIDQALIVFRSIPNGATKAHQTNLVAAMDQQADAHMAQASSGVAAAIGGTSLASVGLLQHLKPSMHWWEWLILGIAAFMVVTGVIAYVQNKRAAALINNAKANVNPDAPKAPGVTPEDVQTAKGAKPQSTHTRVSAKDAESEAIAAAKAKVDGLTSEDAAHAEVESHVAKGPSGPKPAA